MHAIIILRNSTVPESGFPVLLLDLAKNIIFYPHYCTILIGKPGLY